MRHNQESGPGHGLGAATTEKAAARYQHWYCESCKRKLGGLGYILTETGRAPAWHICGLCGRTALITPTDLVKPAPRYRRRSGAGERARAGGSAE